MLPLDEARGAVARGDFQAAYELLRVLDAGGSVGVGELALLAEASYACGDLDGTFDAWERAHAMAVGAGDRLGAARAATRIAMHLMMDTGLLAPVRAWVKRAEKLLSGHPDHGVHAWLAVARAYERLLSGDFRSARESARRAALVGSEHGEPAAAAMGHVAEARSLILAGELETGLDLLDEAAALAVSGEVDSLTLGLIYCELVCAWQALAQYDRAEEWTTAMERFCQRHSGLGSVHGRCRVHRAEILRLRGPCDDAEREALRACDELRPILRREFGWPLTELGLVRLQRGDLLGAEVAFVQALEAGWEPQPGLALLHLARGDVDTAMASIRDALERPLDIPSKELPPSTELRRAPLLAALVEICVASGDLGQARAAAGELAEVAGAFTSRGLRASADASHGAVHLAAGELDQARHALDRAVAGWSELNVPYEAARARVGLARVHEVCGDRHRAVLELRAAASTFERIGSVQHAERATVVADRLERGERDSPGRPGEPTDRSAMPGSPAVAGNQGALRREGDHWSVGFRGRTVRVRDLKGLRYLARLLASAGRELHVLDLVAAEHGLPARASPRREPGLGAAPGDAGPLLDAKAKEAYRRRLAEIDEDMEEARAFGDDVRAARAMLDREFLVQELSRAVGLGGRDRLAGAASERARVSVTRAIRHALARIRQHHPELADHLDHAVRTGTYCSYRPDPSAGVRWEL